MTRPIIATALALCFLLSTHSFSQTSNATLGGIVSDTTNALIPGVTITASNTQTGIVTTVVTNESGAYQFANLQTGTYKVSAELPGFQTQTYSDVSLGVSQQVRLNFTLQVGSVAQAVEVTVAADTLLATSSSSVGTVLPESKVRDLPLGGRNVMDLVLKSARTGTRPATPATGSTTFMVFPRIIRTGVSLASDSADRLSRTRHSSSFSWMNSETSFDKLSWERFSRRRRGRASSDSFRERTI